MVQPIIIAIVVLTALILLFFNVLSLLVLLFTPKLRRRVSNLPVISFLIGSLLQGGLPAPLYIYKILVHQSGSEPGWLCDLYRFPYIFCNHIMEISIMILAFERMWAIRYPFTYSKVLTKRNFTFILLSAWFVTFIVDTIPFFNDNSNDNCSYVPGKSWGLSVIIFYNIAPFVTVIINYAIIWKVAYGFAMADRKRSESLRQCNQVTVSLIDDDGNKTHTSSMRSYQKTIQFTLEIKATKQSIAIAAVFLFCWLPMSILFMADHFCQNCISENEYLARRVVKILAFSSSLLTPLVYCWWNKDFRHCARRMFRCKRKGYFSEASDEYRL